MFGRQYRPWNPDQLVLFPSAMRDALDEGHIVFRILDAIEELDISSITDRIEQNDPRGTRPYHPRMMLALVIYAYCSGIYSSRKIGAATYDIIPFRVLTADQHPHVTVINEFRVRHLDAFVTLFTQVLRLCGRAGLLDLEHVSVDGSKIEANASKHKAMSHGRMEEEIARLEREIREFTVRAQRMDAEEDELFREGKEAHEISEELKHREQRLARIAKAKEELEREARRARERELRERAETQRARAEDEQDPVELKRKLTRAQQAQEQADELARRDGERESDDDSDLPSHKVPTTPDATPSPKAQRNFTDPDSRIMKRGGSYLQGYNCQVAVDGKNQIIVAAAVTNQPPDQEHLVPMVERIRENLGDLPKRLSADSGYMSEDNVTYCAEHHIDAYLAVARDAHGTSADGTAPAQEKDAWRAMREKLNTPQGRAIYGRRKVIVEPVFGHAKEARRFRRFSLRGLRKARGEWSLVCLCGNLLKLAASDVNLRELAPQTS